MGSDKWEATMKQSQKQSKNMLTKIRHFLRNLLQIANFSVECKIDDERCDAFLYVINVFFCLYYALYRCHNFDAIICAILVFHNRRSHLHVPNQRNKSLNCSILLAAQQKPCTQCIWRNKNKNQKKHKRKILFFRQTLKMVLVA